MNTNKLRGKIVENGYTIKSLSEALGYDRSTLYRKLNNDTLSIKDATAIVDKLGISSEDAVEIFFNHAVACDATFLSS